MRRVDSFFTVISNIKVGRDLLKLQINAPEIAVMAKPGHFCMLEVNSSFSKDPLLRRPLSISNVSGDTLIFLYRIAGRGTEMLSKIGKGRKIKVLGPLGTFFRLDRFKTVLMVGGGIGAAPMFFLANKLKSEKKDFGLFLGARNVGDLPDLEDCRKIMGKEPIVSTEDGSIGSTGVITEPLTEYLETNSSIISDKTVIAACGPWPMLRAIHYLAEEFSLSCHVSLEAQMACGVGLCLGCAVESSQGGYLHVCREGPVVESKKIKW